MSSKITSYSRVQTHGVSNTLSGATVPVSNDHTDGSWIITDLYDRELMINTGNGNLQYRAGSNIYTVSSSPTPIAINNITYEIGPWDFRTATAINVIQILTPELVGKSIISINCVIYDDTYTVTNGLAVCYDYITNTAITPLTLLHNNGSDLIRVLLPTVAGQTNYFRVLADATLDYLSNVVNRGYVTVTYID